jgi:hypothetical protein
MEVITMTNDNREDEDKYYNDYDDGYEPPFRHPWREIITFILFMSVFFAGLWWLIWKIYDWL